RPVCETCYKDVCCTICKPVCETCYKDVCETCYRTCVETCYKTCVKTIKRPVTTCKTVTRKVREYSTEQYCVPGKVKHHWERGCAECWLDPCTCTTHHKRGHWHRVACEQPPQIKCRKVCHTRCVCETVPCTKWVKECVTEQVPYTVCK